jgi:hypothetical protein
MEDRIADTLLARIVLALATFFSRLRQHSQRHYDHGGNFGPGPYGDFAEYKRRLVNQAIVKTIRFRSWAPIAPCHSTWFFSDRARCLCSLYEIYLLIGIGLW